MKALKEKFSNDLSFTRIWNIWHKICGFNFIRDFFERNVYKPIRRQISIGVAEKIKEELISKFL